MLKIGIGKSVCERGTNKKREIPKESLARNHVNGTLRTPRRVTRENQEMVVDNFIISFSISRVLGQHVS